MSLTCSVRSFTVYGRVAAAAFQRCAEAAAYVNDRAPESYAVAVCLELPREFAERCAAWSSTGQLQALHGGTASTPAAASDAPAALDVVVEQYSSGGDAHVPSPRLLSATDFLALVAADTGYTAAAAAAAAVGGPADAQDADDYYAELGQRAWRDFIAARGSQYCWMDVSIAAAPVGRVWFELLTSVAPLTCKNFCELCRGTTVLVQGDAAAADDDALDTAAEAREQRIGYAGTTFFRTLKDAWVMAGDVSAGHTGNGGYSCFGRCFPEETFAVRHDAAGILGMCNDGPHTNSSAFYITRRPMSWMDRKFVAFGRVMDGMDVVDAIHAVEVRHNQSPLETITITDCGVFDPSS
ncbi:cyclophilin 12 [Novymonas esmeraldas]|uniref:Cyclophilin 12 n=1 Tax=Novymonas esmeraldas TaxID=1808958 RepID=A0AAW0ENS3_9TRYP